MGGAGQPKERDAEERKAGIIHHGGNLFIILSINAVIIILK